MLRAKPFRLAKAAANLKGATRVTAEYGTAHHADFLSNFNQQAAQKRAQKKPQPLSVEEHAILRQQIDKVNFITPNYADTTKVNISGILGKWQLYCCFNDGMLDGCRPIAWKAALKNAGWKLLMQTYNWRSPLKEVTRTVSMDFLHWICDNYRIKSWGTSWEYFRQFKQLYANVVGQYMDRNDSKEVSKYHKSVLVRRFKLQPPNMAGKQVGDSGDLLALQTFNIGYDTGIFPQEDYRMRLSGIYDILAFTGCRPAELVDNERKRPEDGTYETLFACDRLGVSEEDSPESETLTDAEKQLESLLIREQLDRGRPKALCYEDVKLMIVRHPETGRDILAMAIKFIHHKGADNKPKPTIFFFTPAKRLLFCIITKIISYAIKDGAFAAKNLRTVRDVFKIRNKKRNRCTPVRWNSAWLKRPIFRKCDATGISSTEPLPYHKLKDDMARQSLDYGCEKAIEPKVWRRGAANAANGKAPDSVRDQMMRQDPQWATFNKAYINEQVEFHLQNAYCDEPTEDALIAMLSHIDVMRDPRATSNMVPQEIWDQLEPDPDVLELEEERERLKAGRYQYRDNENSEKIKEVGKQIRALKAQRVKDVRKQYREYYFQNRPTWDIEQQDEGDDDDMNIDTDMDTDMDTDDTNDDLNNDFNEPDMNLDIPERAELARLGCQQPEDLSDDELLERRIQFGECMVALMSKRETVRRDIIAQRSPVEIKVKSSPKATSRAASIDMDTIPATTQPTADDAALLDDPFPCRMNKFQCTECIGDKRLLYNQRAFCFTRVASRNNHFNSQHLPDLTRRLAQDLLVCTHPKCTKMVRKFSNMNEYRSHQLRVHHIELRPAGGKVARSRKSSPAAGRRKTEEPSQVVWRLETPELPATPAEPFNTFNTFDTFDTFNGEGVCQVQDSAAEMVQAAQMLDVAPSTWQVMTAWQQFQSLPEFPMATWPAQGSLFSGDMMAWEGQALAQGGFFSQDIMAWEEPLAYGHALPVLVSC